MGYKSMLCSFSSNVGKILDEIDMTQAPLTLKIGIIILIQATNSDIVHSPS